MNDASKRASLSLFAPALAGVATPEPSPWVRRFAHLIPAGGRVLDLAAGSGRHAKLLAELGYQVEAVDRDGVALAALRGIPSVETCVADLEGGPWPYDRVEFDGIVVTNYLWRPRLPLLLNSLAAGGVLIYETFMAGNERFGKPSNPEFLLRPDELLELAKAAGLEVVAFEQGEIDSSRPAVIQRICARRGDAGKLPPG